MESVDRDGVVGIGVYPGSCDSGVVDGKNLQRFLFGCNCPIHHVFQISKVAHALTALTAKGENRNGSSCNAWVDVREVNFYFWSKEMYSFV